MSTQFKPLEIPPGVVFKPTGNMSSPNWSDANLMRWVEGRLAPVGGQQQKYSPAFAFASRCKAIHGWYGLDQVYYIAYLCEQHLYVDDGSGADPIDISPTPPLAAPGPVGTGGYGEDVYNAGTYGSPRAISTIQAVDETPDAYSLDNFGGILYAMTSVDGRLLQWDPAVGGAAIATPSTDTGTAFAPTGRCFVVTQERFIVIFGMDNDGVGGGGPRRFGWCDQENPTAWDFSNAVSQAGFLDIEPASPIITAIATRSGSLFWTGKKAYVSQFLGLPYVYNCVELAANCTPWSPQSVVTTSAMTVWMSQQGPWTYDGTSILPVQCMVRAFVDDRVDLLTVRYEACAVHVGNFNEVWWFFPEMGTPYNSLCIIYNYRDGWWSIGRMPRSAGITSTYTAHTIMTDGTVVYDHEAGDVYPANVPLPWIETFDLNLASGSRLTTVKQLMPDIDVGDISDETLVPAAVGNLLYSLFYRNSRSLGGPELQTTPIPVRPDGYVDFRVTGRDIRLKIELAGPRIWPITVGQHLIDAVPRGDR